MNMNKTLDLLLNLDTTKIVKPTSEVKIKRLSELAESDVVFSIQALTPDEMDEIQTMSANLKTGSIDMEKLKSMTAVKSIVEPNLKDKELQKKFGAMTPKELLKKLLLAGEIDHIFGRVQELSGYGDDAVEEIKN